MGTPQQQNGYDCGVYAVVVTELLVEHFLAGGSPQSLKLDRLTPQAVQQKREELLQLIRSLQHVAS